MFSTQMKSCVLIAVLYVVSTCPVMLLSQNRHLSTSHNSDSPYPYWIYLPGNYSSDSAELWPVILFLHGRSLSGTNLNLVKKYGLIAEVLKGRDFPAIIVAPQVKRGLSWNPDDVIRLLEVIKSNYHVDSNRVSITGMSMGGYGALYTAGKYPELFCATAAFCGGGLVKDGCRLASMPVWIAHGRKDQAVPYTESLKVVVAIRNCNSENLLFTDFENLNHSDLEKMFRTKELYLFLLGNSKNAETVFPEFDKRIIERH